MNNFAILKTFFCTCFILVIFKLPPDRRKKRLERERKRERESERETERERGGERETERERIKEGEKKITIHGFEYKIVQL